MQYSRAEGKTQKSKTCDIARTEASSKYYNNAREKPKTKYVVIFIIYLGARAGSRARWSSPSTRASSPGSRGPRQTPSSRPNSCSRGASLLLSTSVALAQALLNHHAQFAHSHAALDSTKGTPEPGFRLVLILVASGATRRCLPPGHWASD